MYSMIPPMIPLGSCSSLYGRDNWSVVLRMRNKAYQKWDETLTLCPIECCFDKLFWKKNTLTLEIYCYELLKLFNSDKLTLGMVMAWCRQWWSLFSTLYGATMSYEISYVKCFDGPFMTWTNSIIFKDISQKCLSKTHRDTCIAMFIWLSEVTATFLRDL